MPLKIKFTKPMFFSALAKYQGGYYFLKDKLIQDNYIKANIKNL